MNADNRGGMRNGCDELQVYGRSDEGCVESKVPLNGAKKAQISNSVNIRSNIYIQQMPSYKTTYIIVTMYSRSK